MSIQQYQIPGPSDGQLRFKTEQEFEQEFGKNWRRMVRWDSRGEMDYLFGLQAKQEFIGKRDTLLQHLTRHPLPVAQEPIEHDPVNNPQHYKGNGMESIDVIEAFGLNFLEGNALKYLLRWKKKNGIEDLRKAAWCINRLIENESKRKDGTTVK